MFSVLVSSVSRRNSLVKCSILSQTSLRLHRHCFRPCQLYIGSDTQPSFLVSFNSVKKLYTTQHDGLQSYSTSSSLLTTQDTTSKASEIFPLPLSAMNSLNQRLSSKLGVSSILKEHLKKSKTGYVCELELTWPQPLKFSALGKRKVNARTQASLQALLWLFSHNFIYESAQPNLTDLADSKNKLFMCLDKSIVTDIDEVLKVHSKEIVPILSALECNTFCMGDTHQHEHIHPTLGIPFPTSEELEEWNKVLQTSVTSNKKNKEQLGPVLPIENYRKEILESIAESRVTILKGETGCGKTTMVPQFILEEAFDSGKGAYCNIAVIQPRRLTTVETAKYVAKERGENVGQSIGYSVKMATILPSVVGGTITFLTGMKFAHKFTDNPMLQGISHVVLDEVHLRDIGTDLVMTLLKQAMMTNKDLRVIIMSATVDTTMFESYFNCFGKVQICTVPGRTFPVKMHFLDDLPTNLVAYQKHIEKENSDLKVNFEQVRRIVSWINNTKPAGGILIFVSGWNEMSELQKILSREANMLIVPVHSMFRDCSAAFEPAPNGKRKVILATNIAETSLTFPDIVYVIDCGIHKKPKRNVLSPGGWSSVRMSSEWVTKANVLQRKGRAGRVQPGESFHLFTKEKFSEMESYELPSILTESLEYLVLSIKMVNPDIQANKLLKEFPTPPSERDVRHAVHTLQTVSLLSHPDEKPTPLALAVMRMSSSLPSALALIYSSIFRCFDKTLSIIAAEETPLMLSSRREVSESRATLERLLKESYHESSDHLAKSNAVNDIKNNNTPSFRQTRVLKSFLGKQIKSMSPALKYSTLNENCNEQLVLSIILKSFGSLLVKSHGKSMTVSLRDKSGITAMVKSSSINSKFENLESPFLMYLNGHVVRGNLLSTKDTSVISPLSVLLFLPFSFKAVEVESDRIEVKAWHKNWVALSLEKEDYHRILALRRALKDCLDYFVIAETLNQPDHNYGILCDFRSQLIQCVTKMLTGGQRHTNAIPKTED